jgi:hypothetical protein
MAKRALVPTNNSQHNGYRAADGGKMSAVPALLDQGRESLEALARAYFLAEVAGQARATIDTKRRDLSRFLSFLPRARRPRPPRGMVCLGDAGVYPPYRGRRRRRSLARPHLRQRPPLRPLDSLQGPPVPARLSDRRHQAAARARVERTYRAPTSCARR